MKIFQFKQEIENPMVRPQFQHYYGVSQDPAPLSECDCCGSKAKAQIHEMLYCWDCLAEEQGFTVLKGGRS